MSKNEIEVTITISRKAYEKATLLAANPKSPAGELAGTMTAEEYIEQMVEIALGNWCGLQYRSMHMLFL